MRTGAQQELAAPEKRPSAKIRGPGSIGERWGATERQLEPPAAEGHDAETKKKQPADPEEDRVEAAEDLAKGRQPEGNRQDHDGNPGAEQESHPDERPYAGERRGEDRRAAGR